MWKKLEKIHSTEETQDVSIFLNFLKIIKKCGYVEEYQKSMYVGIF